MPAFHLPCRFFFALLVAVSLLSACGTAPEQAPRLPSGAPPSALPAAAATPGVASVPSTPTQPEAPPAPREFRAVWVSTVANIDWPSRRDLSSAQQQGEIVAILDTAAQMHLNAIILQVRPSADAIYPSEIEPWSEYLSGEQGRAPSPWYDPLQFWVEQAHLRGLELHAWFNPYRARNGNGKTAPSPRHISKTHPEAVKAYGDLLWMDPAEPAAAQQTLAVIADVVRRYDVDGVHIDDYFYPYPLKTANGAELEFPDDAAWLAYQFSGGQQNRADWRRQQVNQLVEAIYRRVHQEKSWVKFGISPFGIGRPDRWPSGISGFSQYDKLYADVEFWLQQGWLDYLAPQLYWPLEQTAQAFAVLHEYWLAQNTQARHVWPGLYTSRIDHSDKSWPVPEILNQVDATRRQPGAGHIHFSMAPLLQNRQHIRSKLAADKYAETALVPASPWLPALPTDTPKFERSCQELQCSLQLIERPPYALWLAVWKRYGQHWQFSVQNLSQPVLAQRRDAVHGALQQVVVSSINRNGQESPRSSFSFP